MTCAFPDSCIHLTEPDLHNEQRTNVRPDKDVSTPAEVQQEELNLRRVCFEKATFSYLLVHGNLWKNSENSLTQRWRRGTAGNLANL